MSRERAGCPTERRMRQLIKSGQSQKGERRRVRMDKEKNQPRLRQRYLYRRECETCNAVWT